MLFEYWRSCVANSNYFDENIKGNKVDRDIIDGRDWLFRVCVLLGFNAVYVVWTVGGVSSDDGEQSKPHAG